MRRLFFICLFVSLTGLQGANYTYADDEETVEVESDSTTISESEVEEADTTEEKTVVIYDAETIESDETEPVTIQQMKENLEELKDEKVDVGTKWETLTAVNGKVIDFLKEDLTDAEVTIIQNLGLAFQQRKNFYEQQLKDNSYENFDTSVETDNDTAAVKANFIQYKLDFYKDLVPYVNTAKKDEYLEYIKSNIEIEKEEKDIKEKIYKQEGVIEERVDTIKEKIIEHKKALEEKLEILIRGKIEEKISGILSTEKMLAVPADKKIAILEKVVERFIMRRDGLLQEDGSETEYIKKKIAIYDIAIEVVQNEMVKLQQ